MIYQNLITRSVIIIIIIIFSLGRCYQIHGIILYGLLLIILFLIFVQVLDFGWPDHLAPPLERLCR